ncbi:hypothetical protein LOTGIDRAFT_162031 [Lottia gigantea]|uniref:FAN-like N-terminal PH domain-containing protein n=1 Tax=Lottia gigantea TaxID=225164 RepID=V4A8F4_LOTGI|nr:hypothetical protein LOTGIDRAFT_162031 [Lottia gigantea]ESO93007.1 hypothetical protein LOTGIDRAFT_162031 [Lottia gigantea]
MPSIKSDDFCKECRVKACGEKFKTRHEYNWRRHMLVHLPKGDKYNEALEAFVKSQIRQADNNFEDVVSEDDDMESVIPPVNLVTHTSTHILKDAVECKERDEYMFLLNYATLDDTLPQMCQLHRASTLQKSDQSAMERDEYMFLLNYATLDDTLPQMCQLHRASTLQKSDQSAMKQAEAYINLLPIRIFTDDKSIIYII